MVADAIVATTIIPMKRNGTPQGCTNFKLRRVTRLVSRHYDAQLAACGIKCTQFSLLSIVQASGPLRPVDLARAMDVDASTLTRNLKPLLGAGWLAIGDGADARSRMVSITTAGRAKREEAKALWRAAQRRLNELLGEDRVGALHALLDDSLSALQQADLHEAAHGD